VRILAISDIHNNVACVRKLRAQERNVFDVIAIPGDIGTHRAAEIFEVLTTFGCPIVYIHGNWDRMRATEDFGSEAHLVHLRVVKIGRLAFTGYSFDDPVAIRSGGGRSEYKRRCRSSVIKAIRKAGVEPNNCVLMAHDRATRLDQELPGLLLHLYGHVHTFDVSQRAGTTYANVSALDRLLPVRRKPMSGRLSYVNAGNYAVIKVRDDGIVSVECRLLARNYAGWQVAARPASRMPAQGELIPEDRIFGNNIRFPKPNTDSPSRAKQGQRND
jgi:Calcineurin-like phosphoesterase superfamily domain